MKRRLALTLILTCFISTFIYATDYHINPSGSDAGGNGSVSSPWQSLQYACTQVAANSGHRIIMSSGTFVESGQCNLPAGVDLIGSGAGNTVVTAAPGFYHAYMGSTYALENIIIKAGEWYFTEDGNQEIRDFSIDGANKQIFGGLYVRNRDNMHIYNLEVYNTYFTGIWIWGSANSDFHNITFRDCSWGSVDYVVGAFNLSELVNVDVHDITVNEGAGGGRGFRSIGSSGDFFKNVRIYDNNIDVYHFGQWNNGQAPNMAMEIWGVKLEKCEIFNNNVNNTISVVDNYHPNDGIPTVRIHHNNMIVSEQSGYPFELSVHNAEVDSNYVYAGNGGYLFAQWEWTQTYSNWNIHHNYITGLSWSYPTTLFFMRKGFDDLYFRNNTVDIDDPASISIVYLEQGIGENINIENNIFKRTVPQSTGYLPQDCIVELNMDYGGSSDLGTLNVRNNIFDGFPGNVVLRGQYADGSYAPYNGGSQNYSGNLFDVDPLWGASGVKPTPYYALQENSGAVDAGIDVGFPFEGNAPDIGAFESGFDGAPPPPPPPPPTVSVVRINAGGPSYTTGNGVVFAADGYYNAASDNFITTDPINNTSDQELYQSERWGTNLAYDIPIANGAYNVILHFAEIYDGGTNAPGLRVFSMNIEEGAAEITNYDIFAEVGLFTATQKTFTDIEVTDSNMDIDFTAITENPKVSAIEIVSASGGGGGGGSGGGTPTEGAATAHDSIPEFDGIFQIGANLEEEAYANWNREQLSNIAAGNPAIANAVGAGVRSLRLKLAEADLELNGYNSKLNEFQHFANLGATNNSVCLGYPAAAHRDDTEYCASSSGGASGTVIRVNAGGTAFTTAGGVEFSDDAYFTTGSNVWANPGASIDNTDDDDMYTTERWAPDFGYEFPVPNGTYDVILHFAEIYTSGITAPGMRVFSIDVENGVAGTASYDIYAEAGALAAIQETYSGIEVTDGILNIDFASIVENPKISAIEVIGTSSGSGGGSGGGTGGSGTIVRVNVGGPAFTTSNGVEFSDDAYYAEGTSVWSDPSAAIANTDDDDLYQTERWAPNLGFEIPVSDGTYDVILHFAEIYTSGITGPGMRVFSIDVENGMAGTDSYDIYAEVGSLTATQQTYSGIEVTDGVLNIDLEGIVENPKVSAIEVIGTNSGSGGSGGSGGGIGSGSSKLFSNMYEDIWDAGENGTPVNENNTYAAYVYNTVTTYKEYVKFWEVMDAVDFDGGAAGAKTSGQPGNWWDNDPDPCDLLNLQTPVENYIRMLRITYEVVKSIDPEAYVALGAITYPSFLDAILRQTDNPAGGQIDTDLYPYTGGAYFDVVSVEAFPHNSNAVQSPGTTGWVYNRHSDAAIEGVVEKKNELQSVLLTYGYDDNLLPAKLWTIGRTGVSRKAMGELLGGNEVQRNFLLKTSVEAPKNGFIQLYHSNVGDHADFADATAPQELMGLYENLNRDNPYQQIITEAGTANQTLAEMIPSGEIDLARTAELQLPANVGGAAILLTSGDYLYMLWAKTQNDNSELAMVEYSFPSSMNITQLQREEWHSSESGFAESGVSPDVIELTGEPAFFTENNLSSFPIELLEFQALPRPRRGLIRILWSTASEQGNDYFTVEKSIDGLAFEAVKDVPSQGNSTEIQEYRTKDTDPIEGISYYRLKQTDIDGAFTYSEVVEVDYEPLYAGDLNVYPIPATVGTPLEVEFSLADDSQATVELKTIRGRSKHTTELSVISGVTNSLQIPTDGLRPGHYFVVVSNHLETLTKKVTILR